MRKASLFLHRDGWHAGTVLAVLAVLSYGVVVPYLGFYWDDWFFGWVAHVGGGALNASLAGERPLLGYIMGAMHRALGESPLGWHLMDLVLRWAGAVAVWWGLTALWNQQPFACTATAALFLVCPSFLHQPKALVYGPMQLVVFLAAFSLACTMNANAKPGARKAILTAAAVGSAFISYAVAEIFVLYEIIRLSWLVIDEQRNGGGWRRWCPAAAGRWVPYAMPVCLFLLWRLFVFSPTRGDVDVVPVLLPWLKVPQQILSAGTFQLLRVVLEGVIFVWTVPFRQVFSVLRTIPGSMAVLGGAVALSVLAFYARSTAATSAEREQLMWRDGLCLGGPLVVAGLLASIVLNRRFELLVPTQRHSVIALLGIAVTTTCIAGIVSRPQIFSWVLSVLIACSVTTQLANGLHHASIWQLQRNLWWQLSWRAPDIAQGTTLLLDLPPNTEMCRPHEIFGAASFAYSYSLRSVRHWGLYFNQQGQRWLTQGEPVAEQEAAERNFELDSAKAILLQVPGWDSADCLRVLTKDPHELPPGANAALFDAVAHSNIGQIDTEATPAHLPEHIFGPEPARTWCYLYQKAELGRQKQDWPAVVALLHEARERQLTAANVTEWLPFLEACIRDGRPEEATQLAATLATSYPHDRDRLQTWLAAKSSSLATSVD